MRAFLHAGGVPSALCALLVTLAASAPCSGQDTEVLGTIRATVDGEERTWYVVRGASGERPYASAIWWNEATGETVVSVGGFDTADLPIDAFEYDPAIGPISFGDYTGSAMEIVLVLMEGTSSMSVELGDAAGLNSLAYMPILAPDFPSAHMPGTGSLAVSEWGRDGDTLSLSGTFSGTLHLIDRSATVEITNGTFQVSGVPSRDALVGGDG